MSAYSVEPSVDPRDTVDVPRIVTEYGHRKVQRSAMLEACRRIAAAYNNDIALPMPEVSGKEAPSVANLISSGIDQHAQRIADVLPDIQCPPVKPGQTTSMNRAAARRRACYGYWDQNEYELRMRKRARWLISYTNSPVWVHADSRLQGPNFDVRSPLNVYPCDDDSMLPDDVILGYTRTVAWVRQNYPGVPLSSIRYAGGDYRDSRGLTNSDPVELVQWLDKDKTVTLITGVGQCDPSGLTREAEYGINGARIINLTPSAPGGPGMWAAVVDYAPNLTGLPQVVMPSRISLEMPRGQFDDTIGLYEMQAKLAAMEFNAIANSIWPDQWLVPSQVGDTPQIIKQANGRAGRIGQISGGSLVTIQSQPGIQTPQAIDRLERAIRLNGQIPADFSGESASNVRTARRGNAILGEAVDYTLAEHQQILARSMQHELELAAAVDVAYYGNKQKSFYVKWKGATGRLDYKPSDVWNDDRTIHVSYAKAGADSEQLTVETGQLVGMGVMSKDTAMRRLPDIEDPEREKGNIIGEALDAALLGALQTQANQGSLPAVDLARIKQRVLTEDLEAAVVEQQKEAQARQAEQVAAQAPEAQPGLAAPGAGAEQPTAIPQPTQDVQNLADLIRNVRTPAVAAGGG